MNNDWRICPRCGLPINVADPSIRRLTPAAYHAYHALRQAVKNGQTLNAARMGAIIGVDRTTVYHVLPQLIAARLITRHPKRVGGVYHVYKLSS